MRRRVGSQSGFVRKDSLPLKGVAHKRVPLIHLAVGATAETRGVGAMRLVGSPNSLAVGPAPDCETLVLAMQSHMIGTMNDMLWN